MINTNSIYSKKLLILNIRIKCLLLNVMQQTFCG